MARTGALPPSEARMKLPPPSANCAASAASDCTGSVQERNPTISTASPSRSNAPVAIAPSSAARCTSTVNGIATLTLASDSSALAGLAPAAIAAAPSAIRAAAIRPVFGNLMSFSLSLSLRPGAPAYQSSRAARSSGVSFHGKIE